jgi:hypothetical protein
MIAFLDWLAQRKKAVAGFTAPGVVLFVADVSDGSLPTHNEWLTIGLACLAGAVGVNYAPKNKPKN